MKEPRWRFLAVLVGIILITAGIPPAYAQDTEDEDEFTLEEVTVTAQKRAESQQKVAITMEVISAEDIKTFGKNNIDEILRDSSSAIIQKSMDGYRVSIRGISDDTSAYMGQSQSNPAVAINLDGVYSNRKDTGSSLFDVERVEVLYGPQSTLYSSNSPGGIVNVVTAAPKLDRFSVDASLEMGNYSLIHTEGAVNVPVGDTTALRASFTTSKRDGYLSGIGGDDEDTKSVRLRALFEPNDSLSMILTGEYGNDKGAGFGSGVCVFDYQDGIYMDNPFDPVEDGSPVKDPWTAQSDDTLAENNQDSYKVFMNLDWDLGFAALSLVPSYAKREGENVMNFLGQYLYNDTFIEEKSAELRLASSPDFFFKWIVGVTYLKSANYFDSVNTAYLAGYSVEDGAEWRHRYFDETDKAVFGNITVPVTDMFRLTAGLRKSWDKTDFWAHEARAGKAESPQIGSQSAPSRPDYKVGFEYDLGTNSMLYGDYSTSFRVQAMTEDRDPQELKAYSLGAKNRFLDNKLQVNAGAFYYDYANYAAGWNEEVWIQDCDGNGLPPAPGPPPPGPPPTCQETGRDGGAENVIGDGRMYGIDLSIDALITPKDKINLSVSWIESEWTDLYFEWEYKTQLETQYDENGNPIAVEVPHPDKDYSGEPMTNTPPWTINLNYTHDFTLWNGGTLKPRVDIKYQTGYELSWEDEWYPFNYQESHYMLNASMVYNHPGDTWSLSAYVNNIENYAEKRQFMGVAGQGRLTIGDPRTYAATLSVKF